jgi:hypothetical protein
MRPRSSFVLTLVMFIAAIAILGMTSQPPNEGLANKIAQARKANSTLMHQYMWESRTVFIMNGETKDTRIDKEQYGPDGQLQKTELNNESSSHPRGLLRKRIAEEKKQELEKYMGGLKKILEQYTLPTAGKMVDFLAGANVQFVQDPSGAPLLMMQGSNVIQPGDNLSVWADPTSYAFRKMQITTTDQDGDPVNVNCTFKTIPPGLTFMSMAEVDLPAKNITLQVHNYDYVAND